MKVVRRYTNLAATLRMLRAKRITLLNPATWDDKNDAYFMAEYKRYLKAKTVLALCFAESPETYHHWRVFSHGPDGCCIEFDKPRLLPTFKNDKRCHGGSVSYKTLAQVKAMKTIAPADLPFMKRYAYNAEKEYRVIYVDKENSLQRKDFDIQIRWISKIILSPWLSKNLFDSVRTTLRSIEGCSGLDIRRSTLIDNETWKELTTRVRA